MCHSAGVQVRGQLVRVGSPLPLRGFQRMELRLSLLEASPSHLLGHLTGPLLYSFTGDVP